MERFLRAPPQVLQTNNIWAPLKIIIMKNRMHPSANAQDFMTFFMIFADKKHNF
jgi:hypothetical protein